MSKKQNLVSLSTAEAEYIAVGSYCAQLLWMKKLLYEYGISQDTMCVFYDNSSAINLSKNPVQHSKSKHIEIWYHFIRDLVEEKVVWLEFINTDNQKADIFTKPLDGSWFESFYRSLFLVYLVFVDITLLFCFWVCWKIQKPIKSKNLKKKKKRFNRLCCIYHMLSLA